MKKLLLSAVLAFGMIVSAQTNVTKDLNGWANIRGVYYSGTDGIDLNNNGKIKVNDDNGVDIISSAGNVSINNNLTVNAQGYTTVSKTITTNGIQNNGNTTNTGTLTTGAGGTALGLKVNGYAEITQNLYVNADQITYGKQIVQGAIIANGGIFMNDQKITGLAAGINATDAVNKAQLDTKADKTQVETDIEKAKNEAITASNSYTDTKVSEEALVREKADKEIYDSISQTNNNLDKEIATRKLEVARLDTRIDNLVTYVGNEFAIVNNRLEGLGASMVALSAAATSSIYNASKPTNLNIATGYYGKATALAVGVSHFFSSNTKVSVNWSQGSNTKSAVGIGAGFAF